MYLSIFVLLLGLSSTSLAQSLPPPTPAAHGPAPAERSLTDRAGAAMGKAAEETTSAFGRAMNWTGRQLESAGQWTARQGENIATNKPETATTPATPTPAAPALPPPVPVR
ncbi:MAG: hypothetical protein FJX32_12575 [Alphaproteobacteria bacterium]|nr:hypothetical protein [Alphaproteobacteria bacterium]